uniref:Uncharacterized protein n=1 Tax=Oryza rufipogon TaxID=4529 RepID=A0A0E0PJ60_ORYRU
MYPIPSLFIPGIISPFSSKIISLHFLSRSFRIRRKREELGFREGIKGKGRICLRRGGTTTTMAAPAPTRRGRRAACTSATCRTAPTSAPSRTPSPTTAPSAPRSLWTVRRGGPAGSGS